MAKVSGWYEVTYASGRVAKMFPKTDKVKTQMLKEINELKACGSITSFKWAHNPRSNRY